MMKRLRLQAFVMRFRSVPFSKTPEKYLRYPQEAVRHMVEAHFFEGRQQ